MSALEEGRQAKLAGEPETANPYERWRSAWGRWMAGWHGEGRKSVYINYRLDGEPTTRTRGPVDGEVRGQR